MKRLVLFLTSFLPVMLSSSCYSTASKATQVATPFTQPSPTSSPLVTLTPSVVPTISPSPALSLTPTFPPYNYEPFSIVFLRDWNLWVADIGERTVERQLTFEPQEMRVTSYGISPDGTRIAYIPYQVETLNSLIKLVQITTGETEIILGENDPYNEIDVVWLDNTKIAYKNQGLVPAFTTENVEEITTYIIYDLISKEQVAITEHKFLSSSPDNRFWLTCTGHVEGCGIFTLHNLEKGQKFKIGKSLIFGNFISWSPDSRFMLFHTVDSPPDDCSGQLVLIDTETLEEKFITPDDKNVWDASFSPSGEILAYEQTNIVNFNTCERGQHNYRLMKMTDYKVQMIPNDFDKDTWDIHWTPDGKRLIFFYDNYGGGREHNLWSMNLDGLDLKPMFPDVEEFLVLTTNP